ncbi:TlpA family protein disulfide reductase [Mariniflexile ostreae]|uniref:TlpA family protein disulfide reductase n=1 Tax=Mariniflexile ostreae TaxID=1520892 RepID=A0ABV5FC41_9FLAO
MKYGISLLLGIGLLTCNHSRKPEQTFIGNPSVVVKENQIEHDVSLDVYDFGQLEKLWTTKDGNIYIINFWATWCAPCIKELPHFEKISELYSEKNVRVILVSLDLPHVYDSKLKPFMVAHQIKSKVIVLDDADMETWVPKVDKAWSGSIPATLIFNNEKRQFYEKIFTYEALDKALQQFLN